MLGVSGFLGLAWGAGIGVGLLALFPPLLMFAVYAAPIGGVVGVADGFAAAVTSLRGLLTLGRTLHDEERTAGNVAVLAQVLAGAQQHEALAETARHTLALWTTEVRDVVRRLLADSPTSTVADPDGLAHAVAAAFVGIELYEGVDPEAAQAALAALEQLAVLAEVVEDLGPVARRALKAKLRAR